MSEEIDCVDGFVVNGYGYGYELKKARETSHERY